MPAHVLGPVERVQDRNYDVPSDWPGGYRELWEGACSCGWRSGGCSFDHNVPAAWADHVRRAAVYEVVEDYCGRRFGDYTQLTAELTMSLFAEVMGRSWRVRWARARRRVIGRLRRAG